MFKSLRLFSLLGLALLPLSISGQNFSRIDSLAMNVPALATRTPLDLVTYCEANATSELEIARFYFVWIARNIRYDTYSAQIANVDFDHRKQSPEYVFKHHKAICTGYSRLLEYLCRLSKIPVLYVAGYGKEAIRPDSIETHAWNVIKLNGEWALFDATWASNSIELDSSDLSVEFERYFMSPSDFFQKGHLPYDPVFQLTQETIMRHEFFKAGSTPSGGDSEKPQEDFALILNRDYALDSLSFTIASHRRGLAFMREDSNIVVKLRGALKEKQYLMTKKAQDVLLEFSKNVDKNLENLSIYTLKDWSERLEKLVEPLQTAIEINKEIESLEVKEEKIIEVKQNRQQVFDLIGYFSQSRNAVKEEIARRH